LKEGSEDEGNKFLKMVDDLEQNERSLKNYSRINEEINISSFIDYIILETFIGNNDWPNNNCTWYKNDGGKWEWIIYDSDVSMAYAGDRNVHENHLDKLMRGSTITARFFKSMMKYNEFKAAFLSQAHELLNTVLSETNTIATYTIIRKNFEKEIQVQIDKWRNIESMQTWIESCEANEKFLIARVKIYAHQLEALE